MSHENLKELSRRALEMWASNNSDRAEDIFAENYINHQEPDAESGISNKNLKAWKELVSGYHEAFSNSMVRVLMQIADDGLVASRWEFVSTHTGVFMGHLPTGRQVTWTGVQIDRFQGDKIVESWVNWDKYRFFEGLGLVK